MHVADFDAAQTDALVRLWRTSFEFGVGVVDPHPLAEQAAYLHTVLVPSHRVRVAMEGEAIVGFLASTAQSIAQLHVRVDRLGQGIGTQLLTLAQAESEGRLWLYTFARNARARRFYESRGFVATAHGFEPEWQLEDVRYEWQRPARPAAA